MYNGGYIGINIDTKSRLNYNNQSASNIDIIFTNEIAGLIDYKQLPDT